MNKTILVTGAAKRIGKEIALTFAAEDWNIIIHCHSSTADAEKLADLRDLRNAKLRDTDFYALSDQTLSNDMKTYRQSLRDITKTYQSMDAEGFAWPTEPS